MKKFRESEIEKFIKYLDEEELPKEIFWGRCFVCGGYLREEELSEGFENKVVCLKDLDYFEEYFKFLQDNGYIV